MKAKEVLEQVFRELDVEVGKDIVIHDDRFYARVLGDHTIGMGESYMEGWWDAPHLAELFKKLIAPGLDRQSNNPGY